MFARVRDLRVASKLFAGFGVVSVLLIVVAVIGVLRLGGAQANMNYLATSGIGSVDTIDKVQTAFGVVRTDLADAALTPDAAGTTAALNQLTTDQTALDAAWTAYLGTDPASSDAQQGAYTAALADYRSAVQALIPLAQANDLDGFVAQRTATAVPAAATVNDAVAALSTVEAQAAKNIAADGATSYHQAVAVLAGCAALALLLAIAIAVFIARSIARPWPRPSPSSKASPQVGWTSVSTTSARTKSGASPPPPTPPWTAWLP